MIHTVHSFVHGCAQVTKVAWRGVVMVALVHGGIAHAGTDPVPLWVQHSATSMGNMGQCAVRLTFDSQDQEVKELISKLQKSLEEIKTLKGIVPICSNCKKIRDDKGYWEQVEAYVSRHTEARFSHGICPECAKKLYPEFCNK